MSGSEPTYEALNISSRSFVLGDKVLMPKIPQTISEHEKQMIENHKWGEFFEFTVSEPPPETLSGGQQE